MLLLIEILFLLNVVIWAEVRLCRSNCLIGLIMYEIINRMHVLLVNDVHVCTHVTVLIF